MADDNKDALGKAYVEIHASLENLGKEIAGAKKLVLKELADIEAGTKKAAAKTNSLGDSINSFYDKNQKSFKATGQAIALTAGAIVAVGAGILALGARGSDVADVRQGFDQLTKGAGLTGNALKDVRTSVDGMITDFDLMKSVNAAFGQGLKLTQDELNTTGEAARVLASRVGGETKDAYDTLLTAMSTGRDMMLKDIGLNIDAKRAVEAFAAGVGVSSDKLSENQIKLAKQRAIIAELNGVMAESGRAQVSFGDRLTQVNVVFQNFLDNLGEAIASSPVLAAGLDSIAKSVGEAFGGSNSAAVQSTATLIDSLAIKLAGVGQVAIEVGRYAGFAFQGWRAGVFFVYAAILDVIAGVKKANLALVEMVANTPSLGGANPAASIAKASLPRLRDETAQATGQAQGAHAEVELAMQDAEAWSGTMTALADGLAKAKAAMLVAQGQAAATAKPVKNLRTAVKDLGTGAIVTAEELKKFHAELRAIQDAGDQALTASLLTGTQAQLAALEAETKSAIANARENAKTRAMGEETVTAITEAEAKKRQAILNTEGRDVAAELRGVYAAIAQTQIAAADVGLRGQLAALDAERVAAREEATFRGLTAESLAQVLLGIDEKYAAEHQRIIVASERDIQRDLAALQHDRAMVSIDFGQSRVKAALAANDLELQDRLDTIAREKNADERLVKETIALYKMRAVQIVRANDPIWRAWQELNEDMRDEWASTWEAALKGEMSWKDAMLKPFKDIGNQLVKVFAGILADLQASFMNPLREMLSGVVSNLVTQLGKVTGGAAGGGGASVDMGALWSSFKDSSSTVAGRAGSAMMGAAGIAGMMQAKTKKQAVLSGTAAGAGIGGAIMPGIGHLVGAGVGALVGYFKGRTLAKKAVKDFEEGLGGAAALKKKLIASLGEERAGELIKGLGNVGTDLKKSEAAIKAVTDAIDSATEAQERWNLSAEDMTPAKRMTMLSETAEGLAKDFKALVGQGFDPSKVATKMSASLSRLVVDAMDAGQKLPASMKPMLDALIRSGNLSDELRDKLLGVAKAALPDWQELEGIAQQYGVAIDSLGPRFQQSKLSATATQIAKDFERLKAAGADVNGLLAGMQDEVQGVVTNALKFGLDVPASMKGMIEQLQAMGQLTDENGNALVDLSRLNFARPIEESVDKLIEKMTELIQVFTTGGATIRDSLNPVAFTTPMIGPGGGQRTLPFPTSSADNWQGPAFADGGLGNFGAGTLAMLHGKEAIIPLDRFEGAISHHSKAGVAAAAAAKLAQPMIVQVDQHIALHSPDAAGMRRLVRGDMKQELLNLIIDDVDGFGRAVFTALKRFDTSEAS